MRCSSLPEQERPRERLFRLGAESLGLSELLAILLRTGTKERDVLELSAHIVEQFGGLSGLLRALPGEFLRISGCGEAKAALLAAAMEVARRAVEETGPASPPEQSWEARIASLARGIRYEEREFLWALFLDGAERILGEDRLSYGGLDGALSGCAPLSSQGGTSWSGGDRASAQSSPGDHGTEPGGYGTHQIRGGSAQGVGNAAEGSITSWGTEATNEYGLRHKERVGEQRVQVD